MTIYYYLSLIPESFLASMLPPEEFGHYYAVGSHKRSRGQAVFFEVTPFESEFFDFNKAVARCIPHPDGRLKHSVYLGIYRVLEHIPLSALKKLYLITEDGRTLGLEPEPFQMPSRIQNYLYQEYCPVASRVVSRLNPHAFCQFITNRHLPISVDKIVFCELELSQLAHDPESLEVEDLPYVNMRHLRDCLWELIKNPDKPSKVVHRGMHPNVLYRIIKSGFFVGDQQSLVHYPFPSRQQLEHDYYEWWRSALSAFRR